MGRSSSKLLSKPNNPLEELQFKESQRERNRKQEEKQRKQIARLQKKQAKKQRKQKGKNKRNSCNGRRSQDRGTSSPLHATQRVSDNSSVDIPLRFDFRREEFNRQLETKIQIELHDDLCGFILNQSALTIQFFKNFENEVSTMTDDLLAKEKELNHNLEEHSILLTNPLDVAVAKWINYKPLHGPDKNHIKMLQPQTIYVVFENIDIVRPNDANYDSISPLCKVDMEMDFRETTPCREDYIHMLNDIKWKGYIRLRMREDPNKLSKPAAAEEDIYSEGSSGYGTTSPYGSKNTLNLLGGRNGEPEQDYDYAFISHLNTQHPLKELKMINGRERHKVDAKVLPDSCISKMGNFVQPLQEEEFTDEEDEDSESEDDDEPGYLDRRNDYRDYDTLQAIKLYRLELEKRRKLLAQSYLNSREFMRYFGELMRKKLAQQLKITHNELDLATFKGSSIYTNNFELIPAIHVAQNVSDWPKCAFEFRLRDRPFSTNPQTGQQVQWPTRSMIKRIETFGFHVVPLGYAPKKKRNPFRDIEWRIVFPKAERYLELHLTNAQLKVFMMTKALLKSFVEPREKNKSLMFALDHLRAHLFWECERDYNAWPEEFLGDLLLRFLNSFKQRVKAKRLDDYFIRERNLFESIPEYSLNTLYTILADITANPLMHLIIAFRNLEFAENYFPKLNLKKLYENLMENDMVKLKLLAKNARALVDPNQEGEEECLMPDEGAKGLVGMKQHHVKTNGKLRRKTHLLRHNIELKKQEMVAKRRSVESIDVEFFFTKNLNNPNQRHLNQGVENLRRTNILEILLDHLIDMAAKALEYQSVVMARTYISQARRLCKCYHNYGCDVGAKEYLGKIHNLDEEFQILYEKEDFSAGLPTLPIRVSIEAPSPGNYRRMTLKESEIEHESKSCNLYEEMVIQENLSTPQAKKSLKHSMHNNSILEEDSEAIFQMDPVSNNSFEPRKSIKFNNFVVKVQDGDSNPIQKPEVLSPISILRMKPDAKDDLSDSETEKEIDEPRKSIKFHNVVVKVKKGDTNPIQRPEGYSPISILRTKQTAKVELDDTDEEEDINKARKSIKLDNNIINVKINDYNAIQYPEGYSPINILRKTTDSKDELDDSDEDDLNAEPSMPTKSSHKNSSIMPSFLKSKLKSSADFLKTSPLGNSDMFQNMSQNTDKFINQMSTDEKKAHIRNMLKRNTLKLKGVFNQSSDT